MAEDFLSDSSNIGDRLPITPSSSSRPSREPVKLMLVGSRRGIAHIIHLLHQRQFAEAGDWSQPQPMKNGEPGEMMSIMVKHLSLD